MNKGYATMKNKRMLLLALLSVALLFGLILPTSAARATMSVPLPDEHSAIHSTVDSFSIASAMALNTPQGNITPMVAAGGGHIVGLKSDGTVVAMGDNNDGQCNVGNWTDIIQVAAGCVHTVGLKSDGTVWSPWGHRTGFGLIWGSMIRCWMSTTGT